MGGDMRAFHNDPAIKTKYLDRVRAHRAADNLIQGTGWEDGKGCAVGCTLESYDHARYPIELGVPEVLAYLEDGLFERLPPSHAQLWPERFLTSINVGADLSGVWPQFAVWLLSDPVHGVLRYADERTKPLIEKICALYRDGGTEQDFREAAQAADAACAAACAACAAEAVAADAARAAADAWTQAAAEKLLNLLSESA